MQIIHTLSAVVVGGLLTTFCQLILNWHKNKQAARQVALAFKGEIESLLLITEKRKYIELLEEAINLGQPFYFRITFSYFNIYDRNADKIGLLKGDLPQKISTFYTQAYAILEDILDIQEEHSYMSREETIGRQQEMLRLAKDTIEVGKDILKTIDELYS